MTRTQLPDARQCDSFEFDLNGVPYHARVGRFTDGSIAEIFLDGGKVGSGVDHMAKDAATVFSIARQFDVPLDTIKASLSKLSNGEPAGPLGVALDLADLDPADRPKLALVP